MKKLFFISLLSVSLFSCECEPLPTGVPKQTPTSAVQGVVPNWAIGDFYNEETGKVMMISEQAISTDLEGLNVPFAATYSFSNISALVVSDSRMKWLQNDNKIMYVYNTDNTEVIRLEVSYDGKYYDMGYYTKL